MFTTSPLYSSAVLTSSSMVGVLSSGRMLSSTLFTRLTPYTTTPEITAMMAMTTAKGSQRGIFFFFLRRRGGFCPAPCAGRRGGSLCAPPALCFASVLDATWRGAAAAGSGRFREREVLIWRGVWLMLFCILQIFAVLQKMFLQTCHALKYSIIRRNLQSVFCFRLFQSSCALTVHSSRCGQGYPHRQPWTSGQGACPARAQNRWSASARPA